MGEIARRDSQYLRLVLGDYTNRLLDRLSLENMGISVNNPPVGGPEGMMPLQDFWKLAKEGFRMTFRMDRDGHKINPRLLLAATQEGNANGIWTELSSLGISLPLETTRTAPSLTVFGHILVSICDLNIKGGVSLASLEPPLKGRQLGHLAQQETDWGRNINAESVWFTILELQRGSNRGLYNTGNFSRVSIHPVLRAAHFFAQGTNLSRSTAA